MSLYAKYCKERENKEIIEDERGFATYVFLKDGVYVVDIYVCPDHRHSNVAASYADQIAQIAKAKGLNKLYGSVAPNANNSADSIKVLLAYGFKPDPSQSNLVFFVKELS